MLVKPSEIISSVKPATDGHKEKGQDQSGAQKPQPAGIDVPEGDAVFVNDPETALTKAIGIIQPGKSTHYYSYGNFNLVRLMMYLIKQTGPVHTFMTSYSFSQKSIEQIHRNLESGQLLSFKVIVDNRVRTMSPKPFQMLSTLFDYRCSSVHAKVALLWNHQWNISIVTSQNATDNPKLERGSIFTSKAIFEFDLNALENEFNRGST